MATSTKKAKRKKEKPMVKEWPVPQEVADLIEEAVGAEELRAIYAKEWFGFKKALRCSTIAAQRRKEFWAKVNKLYPDLPTPNHYNLADKVIRPGAAK